MAKRQQVHLTLGSILFLLISITPNSKSQLSAELSNTILKMHSLKIETEECYNKFRDIGSYVHNGENQIHLGLTENCSNCRNLTMEQHFIRLHRIVTKFVQPVIAVYKFQKRQGSNEISQCIENVQHILFTLKVLTELQAPAGQIRHHLSEHVGNLKMKVKKVLERRLINPAGVIQEDDVMKELSAIFIKELFITAIVLQKDRLQMQNLA